MKPVAHLCFGQTLIFHPWKCKIINEIFSIGYLIVEAFFSVFLFKPREWRLVCKLGHTPPRRHQPPTAHIFPHWNCTHKLRIENENDNENPEMRAENWELGIESQIACRSTLCASALLIELKSLFQGKHAKTNTRGGFGLVVGKERGHWCRRG